MASSKKAYLIDLHVHTDVSPCGGQSLKECLLRAKACGLSLLGITDHFSTEALSELAHIKIEGAPKVLVGMEYSTKDGDFLLFAPKKVPSLPKGLPTEEVLAEIKRLGGLVIWAHPFRWRREIREEILAQGLVDAIEVLNGRTPPLENEKALFIAKAYDLAVTAGSDAHFSEELGRVANVSPVKIESFEDLAQAIKQKLLRPEILAPELRNTYGLVLRAINKPL